MTAVRPIKVALDVRMPAGQWGGVQQLAEGLARGLSTLDGEDEFLFLGYADAAGWLDPLLAGRSRRVEVPQAHGRSTRRRVYDAVADRSRALAGAIGTIGGALGGRAAPIPRSDGFLESLGVDVVHFVTPQAYLTDVPSLYQPLDLLHVHVPEQFSTLHRDYRERAYRAFSEQAACVVSMTQWGRTDLASHYGLPTSKIAAVPLPPVVVAPRAPSHSMPRGPYLIYPAQTWPHKNHMRLIEAVHSSRSRGVPVVVVCTGRQTSDYAALARRVEEEDLGAAVQFAGYLDEQALAELYANATALVFPSRFEGWGLPVVEAMASGLPVACSDIPVLREVAGDAALFFDPMDTASIARAMETLWLDGETRNRLRAAGLAHVAPMRWAATAATYRALYRRAAGTDLSEEDRALLVPPTVVS